MQVTVEVALRVHSALNERIHWGKRARRTKHERMVGFTFTPRGLVPPLTITLTRIAPRMLDSDNLAASFKGVRDGIADRIGIKDNDPRVTWAYAQRKGEPGHYGVEMNFREIDP